MLTASQVKRLYREKKSNKKKKEEEHGERSGSDEEANIHVTNGLQEVGNE